MIVPDPRPFEPRRRPRPETCTVGCTRRIADRRAFVQLPSLRLSGQWLADAGFAVGAKPRVEVIEGALTLTPSAATESPEPGSRPRTKPLRRAKA
ncbi:MAG TPA: SymE family type I addiction module toxin [Dokdonella sp.]